MNNNRYYLGLLTVAMATIVVDSTGVLRSKVTGIFVLQFSTCYNDKIIATIQMVYKFVQNDAHIYTHCQKY